MFGCSAGGVFNSNTGYQMNTINVETNHGFSFSLEFYGCTKEAANEASLYVIDELNKLSNIMVSAMWGQMKNFYDNECDFERMPTDQIRSLVYEIQEIAETEAGMFDFADGEVDANILAS